jgi:hypothetical protein
MKDITCPNCGQKTKSLLCVHCHEIINESDLDPQSKLRHKLDLAILVNREDKIIDCSKAILVSNPDDFRANYYYAHGRFMQEDDSYLIDFLNRDFQCTEEELNEVIFHLIRYKTRANIERIRLYIISKIKDEAIKNNLVTLLDDGNNIDETEILKEKLFDKVSLRIKKAISMRKHFGKVILIWGLSLSLLTSIWIFFIYKDIKYFTSIILLVIPSLIVGLGIVKIVMKKSNVFAILGISFLVLYVLSFINLIGFQEGLINHLYRVIMAPYEFIMYQLKGTY